MNGSAILGGLVAAGTVAGLVGYALFVSDRGTVDRTLGDADAPSEPAIRQPSTPSADVAAAPFPTAEGAPGREGAAARTAPASGETARADGPAEGGPAPGGDVAMEHAPGGLAGAVPGAEPDATGGNGDVAVVQDRPAGPSRADPAAPPPEQTSAEAGPAPQSTPRAPDASASSPPVLGMVRVDATGGAVVAGTAPAAARVVLRLDGVVVASAEADGSGSFVSLFDIPTAQAPRLLTLETQDAAGEILVRAEDSVIVAPTVPPHPVPGAPPLAATATATPDAAAPRPDAPSPASPSARPVVAGAASFGVTGTLPERPGAGRPPAGTPTAVARPAPATDTGRPIPVAPGATPDLTASAGTAPETPSAPRLFRTGPGGLSAIPSAAPEEPEVLQGLGIDVIAYDEVGDVQLTGRAQTDSELRIYLDNAPVQTVRVGPDGEWSAPLPGVDSGVYTLRVDEVGADGEVTARVETPFQRTAPEIAAQARREGAEAITVQTGYTLWALSEGYFGDGVQYVQLFEANRDQIRDPDLIYPGQVFRLPPAE